MRRSYHSALIRSTDVSFPPAQPLKRPFLVRQTSSSRLFYKQDDTWCVPRATAYFLLKS